LYIFFTSSGYLSTQYPHKKKVALTSFFFNISSKVSVSSAPQAASKDIETCFLPCVSTQYIGNFFFDAVVGCVIGVKSPAVKIKSAATPRVTTGTFLLFSNFLNTVFNFCNIKNHPETILFGVIFLMPFIQKLSGKNLLNLIYHWYLYKYPTVFLRRTDYRQQLQHAL